MEPFSERMLASDPDDLAPDGSSVRLLCDLPTASTAHFALAPGQVSVPQQHRTVSEIWFVLAGTGQMWRRQGEDERVVDLEPGLSLTLPVGTAFQFRAAAVNHLDILGVTMPPWPGADEAFQVDGPWESTVG